MFGPERRGAPVVSFLRFDEKPIRRKTQIYHPNCLVVIDPFLIQVHSQDIVAGLKPQSILVINTISPDEKLYSPDISLVGFVDATRIGLEEIGTAITNTCMIGAFARTTGWVQLDSILYALGEKFKGRILEKNIACAKRGFEETTFLSR